MATLPNPRNDLRVVLDFGIGMATSEIEKLERRYAENPNGLTFAPLAEVHRKNGDIPRALELLGPGLERYPDYIPARIVLGRCHLDLGELGEAETAFTHVLSLDGENVIALKALADISERLLRYDDAERWLNALLAIDRNNDDAREQLARLSVAREQADLGSAAVLGGSEVDAAATEVEPLPLTADSAALEVAAAAEPEAPLESPVEASVEESVVESASYASDVDVEPAPIVLDELTPAGEPLAPPETVVHVPGLVTPDAATLRDDLNALSDDFQIETEDDVILRASGGSEFQMPDASQELVAAQPDLDPFGFPIPTPAASDKRAAEPPAPVVPSADRKSVV